MGIVRNLVVRFKNRYKDIVNEVVNKRWKRYIAGATAFVLWFTPVPGLTENSEVELTTETGIENQVKDMPSELTNEEQLASAAIGVIAGAPSEEVIENTQHETRKFTSVEEFMNFKDTILQKKGYGVIWQSGDDAETLEKEINGLILALSYDSCSDIEKELEKRKDFFQEPRYNSFVFNNYNSSLPLFGFLFHCSILYDSKFDIDLSDFILDEARRKEFKELYDSIRACCVTRKRKGSFDANQLREATAILVDARSATDESNDLQSTIYLAVISASTEQFISENSKKMPEGKVPNLDSKNPNEVAKACELSLGEIRRGSFYDIHDYDPSAITK